MAKTNLYSETGNTEINPENGLLKKAEDAPKNSGLFLKAIIAGGGGLVFGINASIIGGAILFIKDDFNISVFEISLVVAMQPLGSLAGTIFSGYFTDRLGRWRMMQSQNVFFALGAVICASAKNLTAVYLGRLLVGLGSCLAAVSDVPYLNEISPISHRGWYSSSFEMQIVFGTVIGSLLCLLVDGFSVANGWRILFALPLIPAIINSLLLLYIPESPRWLVSANKQDKARASICSLRGLNFEDPADRELVEFEMNAVTTEVELMKQEQKQTNNKSILQLYIYPLKLVLLLVFFIQFTGSVVIRSFAPSIFEEAGFSMPLSLSLNFIISIINFIFVSTASYRSDITGRKTLLLVGISVIAIGLLLITIGFLSSSKGNVAIFLVSCLLTSIGFNIGFGPVGWLLASEMFPSKIRGRAIAISTGFRNICEFVSLFLFLEAVQTIGPGYTFGIFLIMAILAFVFVYFWLVETMHRTPEEILHSLKHQFIFSSLIWKNANDHLSSVTEMSSHQHDELKHSLASGLSSETDYENNPVNREN